jgi:hypothetical protein
MADMEFLGPVSASGSGRIIVGMFTGGKEGFGLLKRAALEKYGTDVATVVYIFSDYTYSGVFYPFVGKVATTYYGTAVRMKTTSRSTNSRVTP